MNAVRETEAGEEVSGEDAAADVPDGVVEER